MTEHKNNVLHNDYESICLIFSSSCGPIGKIFFEAARTYQSYRASLSLAIGCLGALLVCTLLPGALETGLTPYWYLFGYLYFCS